MAADKKPKANPVRRMLERMGSQMESMGGVSGDESDSKQVRTCVRAEAEKYKIFCRASLAGRVFAA